MRGFGVIKMYRVDQSTLFILELKLTLKKLDHRNSDERIAPVNKKRPLSRRDLQSPVARPPDDPRLTWTDHGTLARTGDRRDYIWPAESTTESRSLRLHVLPGPRSRYDP